LEAFQGKQNSTASSQDINSKKGNTTMLTATPDEILQKGLEMVGWIQSSAKAKPSTKQWLKRNKIK
jgi:hypothetical protein